LVIAPHSASNRNPSDRRLIRHEKNGRDFLAAPLALPLRELVGYASSTDNITGDGWVSLASADMSPSELI
jgi:hypothetical protein